MADLQPGELVLTLGTKQAARVVRVDEKAGEATVRRCHDAELLTLRFAWLKRIDEEGAG